MAATATSTTTLTQTLQDYEVHLTGPEDLLPRHVWVPLLDHGPPPAGSVTNPPGWDEAHRGVPPYRPINTQLNRSARPWGSNPVEDGFVFIMLNGVWLTGVSLEGINREW
jgi:hypothetical protein